MRASIAAAAILLVAGAQPGLAAGASPTMARIAQRQEIRLGHRDSSIPFSYVAAGSAEPVGFTVDVCKRLVNAISQELKVKSLTIIWIPVTSATRVSMMQEGKIDLECGSTTNTADRRRDVAFTIPHYVAGVRILSPRRAALESPMALQGKTVSTNKGSTAAEMIESFNRQLSRPINVLLFATSSESFAAVRDGKADAWMHDDVQLVGQRAASETTRDFVISSSHLSIEPLAVMLPKSDPAFKVFVDASMRSLMRSGEMERLYSVWFEKPIQPNGMSLNLPINFLTHDIYRNPSDYVPDLRLMRLQ
jgi:glutamate/aspartate transport system substrate-binding protein